MRAMILVQRGPIDSKPLQPVDLPEPEPKTGEVQIAVEVCAICRTDLHIIEGELPVHKSPVIPGHQAVGRIRRLGVGTRRFLIGDRVGVAWLHAACGRCPYCLRGDENLCDDPRFTGYDVDGGFAEYVVAPEAFVYPLPGDLPAHQAAPLLCAGIIGYRALHRSRVPKGGRLGIYGFGASAHVVIQIARHWGCKVYVATRGERHRELAFRLGAIWVGGIGDPPPEKLNAAIIFAPAGDLVPPALEALDKGGSLALAGISMTDIPALQYDRHLFNERSVRSVTANTRRDGEALLTLAREIPIKTHTELFPLDKANEALIRLKHEGMAGAGVLTLSPGELPTRVR